MRIRQVRGRTTLPPEDVALLERHAARRGVPLQELLDDAFSTGIELMLEDAEVAELPADEPELPLMRSSGMIS
ncbi:MAG TPA: hypothetical protein VJU87_10760 [Gemmatimonadaceae bacterium]|nr:hypothetical protein [Gemmatimonadaceae bacterium]